MTSTICASRQIQRQEVNPEPVGKDWIDDLERLFQEKSSPPECEAARAVEGHDPHPRDRAAVPSDRMKRVGA
ncbi:hypothetical protein [Rhizobium sp. RCAM05973]|uniref:hypothetical protein n=1 Tax=Rhizobium sp. RCAM05973 TaxID=2994066 RepID=UPI0022EBD7F6|nr:hypothetical protein [Rhizobium sp. RCAM05973]